MTSIDSAPLADFRLEHDDDTVTVAVIGQLDLSNHIELAQLALPHADEARRIVLDLSETSFIDMASVGIVARLRNDLRRHGGELQVVPSRRVLRALTISGLSEVVVRGDGLASESPVDGTLSPRSV